MSKPTAILLATFNGEKWLDEQLQSIRYQTHSAWRLYVRDDLSQDGTLDIVHRHAAEDARILPLSNTIASGSAAANFMAALLAIDLQDFDYVAFCDQDDIWAPGRLARALTMMTAEAADAYSCDLVAFNNDIRRSSHVRKNAKQQAFDYLFQGASAGCTYVLTRQAAQHIAERLRSHAPGMSPDKSHDWLIYAVCRSAGLRWLHDEHAQVFYRQHASNVYGANSQWTGLVKRLRMARSGWYRRQIVWHRHFMTPSREEMAILVRVERFGFIDRCWLALRVRHYRRDKRQALLLAVLLLLGWM